LTPQTSPLSRRAALLLLLLLLLLLEAWLTMQRAEWALH